MKKKLAIVIPSLKFGGNVTSAVNIAKCVGEDYDVTLVVHEVINQIPYFGKVISLDCPIQQGMIGKIATSIKRLMKLKKLVKENQFDCMIEILPTSNILNYSRYGIKKIVSCRDYGSLVRDTKQYALMVKTSEKMVFNSKAQMDYFLERYPIYCDRCSTIYNVVDLDRIQAHLYDDIEPDILSLMKEKRVIVAVGRFCKAKGFNNLIRSFAILAEKYQDIALLILGDGELRPQVEQMIDELGLHNRIITPGFRKDPYRYISRASLFVLSSYFEGFPNVLVEAMGCGTAVVSTDCLSGPAEILQTEVVDRFSIGENGVLSTRFSVMDDNWIVHERREEHYAFADAMAYVLDHSEEARQMADHAKRRVQDFQAERIRDAWLKVLQG